MTWLAIPENSWSLAIFALCGWIAFAFFGSDRTADPSAARRENLAFVALTFFTVFAFRWPTLFIDGPLNPDEARMGAQALKALHDPLPWHGFDGATGGPFDSYPLAIASLFPSGLTFFWIHFGAIAIGASIVCLIAVAASVLYGSVIGRAASALALGYFCLLQEENFVHYSSELVPALLIAVALVSLSLARTGDARRTTFVISGIAIGLIPFSKLQAAPIALFVATWLVIVVLTRAGHRETARRNALAFVASAGATSGIVVAATALTGSLRDAYFSYVTSNLAYVSNGNLAPGLSFFLGATPDYAPFAVGASIVIVLATVAAVMRGALRSSLGTLLPALALVATAVICVETPHQLAGHYLTLLVAPVCLLFATCLGMVARSRATASDINATVVRYAALPAVIAFALLPTLLAHLRDPASFQAARQHAFLSDPAVVRALRTAAQPGTTMSVWGWMPEFYVYTNTIMATKDADTYDQIAPVRYRDYFRARYITDFTTHEPAIFVDSVAPGSFQFRDRDKDGFETFPELRRIVGRDYTLVDDVDGVRIFRKRG